MSHGGTEELSLSPLSLSLSLSHTHTHCFLEVLWNNMLSHMCVQNEFNFLIIFVCTRGLRYISSAIIS